MGEIEEILVLSYCIWFGVEKWRDEKLFYLVAKKNEMIKIIVCINLLTCPFFRLKKIEHYIFINKLYTNGHFIKREREMNARTHNA